MNWEFVLDILAVTVLWRIASNEAVRWMKARQNGFRGASEAAGIAIDLVGGSAYFAYYPWLVLTGLTIGWPEALVVAAITFVVTMFINSVIVGDRVAYWVIGLLSSPALAIFAYVAVLSVK